MVRNAQHLGFAGTEKTLGELADKARNNQLALEEMAGGTFTISNGGVFGSMMGTPILNLPQSAILGMHATKMRPAVVDVSLWSVVSGVAMVRASRTGLVPVALAQGEIVARPVMYLALTYDHRLIDGREAVTFLCSIRDKVRAVVAQCVAAAGLPSCRVCSRRRSRTRPACSSTCSWCAVRLLPS